MSNQLLTEERADKKETMQLLGGLKELSVRRIEKSYDPEMRLFCYRSVLRDGSIGNEGVSLRYGLITLLGLYRLQHYGHQSAINLREAAEGLLKQTGSVDNIGDAGLYLWLCSLYCPEHLGRLLAEINMKDALHRYSDAQAGKTTELSWFLTGLSYMALNNNDALPGLEELAAATYRLLKDNYRGKGIFGHQNARGLKGALRGRIGAFADQVYPIYAFSRFAQAYENREALDIAIKCGKKICALQGDLGQWWWHYDAVTGKVVGRYPVFSVHQDGMAPMALYTLAEVSQEDFDKEIYKGLDWITGNNELAVDMRDASLDTVWRCIHRPAHMRRLEIISSLIKGRDDRKPDDLTVLHECRPYCFGWFLYAFAGKIK